MVNNPINLNQNEQMELEINNISLDVREELFKRGILEGIKHSTSSPETIERFEKIEHLLKDLTDAIMRLEKNSIERAKIIDEMYKPFVEGKTVGKAVYWFSKWSFGVFVGLLGAILLWKEFIQEIFHGQS